MFLWPFVLFNSAASFTKRDFESIDIILFGNHFSGFPLYFPIGIWTQTYRNPTSFLFGKVFTRTLATLGPFLPFFSDLLGF